MNPSNNNARCKPFFAIGATLFVLGPVIYYIQIRECMLNTPWHVPILATVGVALMGYSVWQRRGIWRSGALVFFALLCGLEWFFVVHAARTGPYEGPPHVGTPIPDFTTRRADGAAFTHKDLAAGTPTLMVFFRGHW